MGRQEALQRMCRGEHNMHNTILKNRKLLIGLNITRLEWNHDDADFKPMTCTWIQLMECIPVCWFWVWTRWFQTQQVEEKSRHMVSMPEGDLKLGTWTEVNQWFQNHVTGIWGQGLEWKLTTWIWNQEFELKSTIWNSKPVAWIILASDATNLWNMPLAWNHGPTWHMTLSDGYRAEALTNPLQQSHAWWSSQRPVPLSTSPLVAR